MAVLEGPSTLDQAQVSPNGKWIAYRSSESGRTEVYVQSFPPSGGRWQVSTTGGSEPRWRRDGKELFYVTGTELMAVEVKADPSTFEAGIPKPLFGVRLPQSSLRNRYVVAANGQRFLFALPVEETTASPFTVVLNWAAGVKR